MECSDASSQPREGDKQQLKPRVKGRNDGSIALSIEEVVEQLESAEPSPIKKFNGRITPLNFFSEENFEDQFNERLSSRIHGQSDSSPAAAAAAAATDNQSEGLNNILDQNIQVSNNDDNNRSFLDEFKDMEEDFERLNAAKKAQQSRIDRRRAKSILAEKGAVELVKFYKQNLMDVELQNNGIIYGTSNPINFFAAIGMQRVQPQQRKDKASTEYKAS